MLEHLGLMSFLAVGSRRNTIQFCSSPAEQQGKSPREDWEKGNNNNNNQPKEFQTERRGGKNRRKKKIKGQTNPSP